MSVILFTGEGSASVHAGIPPPGTRNPLGPGTPRSRHPPGPGTTPGTRHHPQSRHPPPGPGTPQDQAPPGTRHPLPGSRRLLLRTVRILLECVLVDKATTINSCLSPPPQKVVGILSLPSNDVVSPPYDLSRFEFQKIFPFCKNLYPTL